MNTWQLAAPGLISNEPGWVLRMGAAVSQDETLGIEFSHLPL